jgi:hypothetical protein
VATPQGRELAESRAVSQLCRMWLAMFHFARVQSEIVTSVRVIIPVLEVLRLSLEFWLVALTGTTGTGTTTL